MQDQSASSGNPLVTFHKIGNDGNARLAHKESCGQLLGSVRGLLSAEDSEARWVVPATHGIWIPPGHHHALRCHGSFQGWLVRVAAPECASLPTGPRIIAANGLLREAVSRAMQWSNSPRTTAQHHLVRVVLNEIATLPHENLGIIMPQTPGLFRVATEILKDLNDCRSLEAWALWGHLSVRTLSRRFSLETGLTFTQWRQQAKLLRGLEMLAEGLSITAISLELGYTNTSAFIALFRRTFGVTPARYAPEQPVYDGECTGRSRIQLKALSVKGPPRKRGLSVRMSKV